MEKRALHGVDKFFLGITLALLIVGIVFFVSASLGVLAKDTHKFLSIIFNQLVFGLLGGIILFFIALKMNYKALRKYAFLILILAIILTMLVFIPGFGYEHGGAERWLSIGFLSFQPVEFLKIAFVIYLAAWLSWVKHRVEDVKYGIIPIIVLLGIIAVILFKQPDTKSFILMLATGGAMLFVSGVPLKYLLGILGVSLVALFILASATPYLKNRLKTFLDPAHDPLGSSYQLQQSLIALGSGGVFGRGIGQSVQKFSYLPEPQGDSIFAVLGEEFGFIGTTITVVLYMLFAMRGLRIAYRAQDPFSRLLATGIVILITAQSFMNIGAITGLFPLTGVPLVFMSHGGTALAFSLFMVGIVANISRNQRA